MGKEKIQQKIFDRFDKEIDIEEIKQGCYGEEDIDLDIALWLIDRLEKERAKVKTLEGAVAFWKHKGGVTI